MKFCHCGHSYVSHSGNMCHQCVGRCRGFNLPVEQPPAKPKVPLELLTIDDCTPMLWEVLVPTVHRVTGKPIHVRFHRVWDAKVRELTGGLSIMSPIRGQWVSPDGVIYFDRMIPVRVAATRLQLNELLDFTKTYYNELEVFAYLLSNTVVRR